MTQSALQKVQENENYEVTDVHPNVRGNDVVTFENKETGDKRVFTNVHHGDVLLPEHEHEPHTLKEVEQDPKYDLIDVHTNKVGKEALLFENNETGKTIAFNNVNPQ
ncbi:hypothetical protein AKO1_010612 [Acrasis kona]|uniref:Uncharacterized protein n=1 Tax=Acrasis kona TaxID=1008807 RepID=A0AAW2ZJ15_9EUKA